MTKTIESDENIEFKPTSAQADSLNGNTIADKKNSYVMLGDKSIDSVRIIPGRMASGLVDSVWNAYASLVSWCKDEVPHFLNDERLKPLVAGYLGVSYWVRQEKEDDNGKPGIATTPPSEVHAVDLLNFMRATYGDYFTQTDFGQELSAQGDAKVGLARYTAKFPEVNALAHSTVSRELTAGKVAANPYLLVLHAAPEFRVALAGAIYIAEQNGEFNDIDFNAPVNVSPACHPKPSFRSLLQFAEMLGIRDLKPLMEELEKIPQIKYIQPQPPSPGFGGILGKKRKPGSLEDKIINSLGNLNNIIKPNYINYLDKKLSKDNESPQDSEFIKEYLISLSSIGSAPSTPVSPAPPDTQTPLTSPTSDTPVQPPLPDTSIPSSVTEEPPTPPARLLKRILTLIKPKKQ